VDADPYELGRVLALVFQRTQRAIPASATLLLAACLSWDRAVVTAIAFTATAVAQPAAAAADVSPFEIRVAPNHPWLQPYGLERIDGPVTVTVTRNGSPLDAQGFHLDSFRAGKIIQRHVIQFPLQAPLVVRKQVHSWPDEVVLRPAGSPAREGEIVRQRVQPPAFEADAMARPDSTIHPVDLGVILFPENRLLLGPGQNGTVEVAAICRTRDIRDARIDIWFESNPAVRASKAIELKRDSRLSTTLAVPTRPEQRERDVLRVAMFDGGGKELWNKTIPARFVRSLPALPPFGATEIELNYELPIAVYTKGGGGEYEKLDYEDGWDPKFKDVVVTFPNGARFVFWRGASFIPFWAGRHNTGFTYEWSESAPPKEGGFVDAVEPLMDKELRYSRVAIVESTVARVHVRWTYQSCDFNYKVWGDSMQEDFYFYPDGFGTRVLTLKSTPGVDFEVSELIVLSAAGAYPLEVLPENLVDFIFLDGEKRELKFPQREREATDFVNPNDLPPIYRVRIHRLEKLAPVYFSPWDRSLPFRFFRPFEDQGELVTMAYWGSHWPLSRGQNTGHRKRINDGVHTAPAHNSIMTWGYDRRPEPLKDELFDGPDALGQKRRMQLRVWSWLIGMTDASDAELLDRARSYGKAAPLEIKGAESVDWNPTTRSFGVTLDSRKVRLELHPRDICVNPAFEFSGHGGELTGVRLGGDPVPRGNYRWDGKLLWLAAKLTRQSVLQLEFDAN